MTKHQTVCNFTICIYNCQNECMLDGIDISGTGNCNNCIIVEIPDEIQEYYKKQLLERLG